MKNNVGDALDPAGNFQRFHLVVLLPVEVAAFAVSIRAVTIDSLRIAAHTEKMLRTGLDYQHIFYSVV